MSKWRPFSFIFNGETEKIGVGGEQQSCCFGKKFHCEKGSVRQCIVVMQKPVLLSSKFGVKSSHIFMQLPYNITVVCGIDYFACQDKFFVNIPLMTENDEHALYFALHLSRLFLSQ
jgi:hypothetical protein